MRVSVVLLAVLLDIARQCELGDVLMQSGNTMLLNFTTGDYQGFEIPSEGTGTEMCLYVPLLVQCETLRDFLRNCSDSCTKPLQHSRKYVVYDISNHGTESRILNFRMLPPDNYTKDKAYVVRIYNETLMYFAENGTCSIHRHLYEQWTPRLLRYYDDECLQTECPTTIISTIIRTSTVTQDVTRVSSSTIMPTSTVAVVIKEETTVMPSCSFTATTELPTISDGQQTTEVIAASIALIAVILLFLH